MARGFMHLIAIMDWATRKIHSWRLSKTRDTRFCIEVLKGALFKYGTPEIFKTDQGCQFTSETFTSVRPGTSRSAWSAKDGSRKTFSSNDSGSP
jgi:putative transposase